MTSYDKLQETHSSTMNNHQQTNVPMQFTNSSQERLIQQQQQQQQSTYTVLSTYTYTWIHFVMNTILFICSCSNPASMVFTVLGMVFSANAYSSHGDKQYERAKRQNHIAKIFWIISLIFTIISVIIIIIVVSAVASTVDLAVDDLQNSINDLNTETNNLGN